MPYTLVLNSTNVIGSNNSQFQYNFINGNFTINDESEMCVSQIIVPYSWFNINKQYYNNATLSYRWYYGVGLYNTYTITFPNGYYNISDLNNYIQLFLVTNNQYFINTTTGNNLYYIQLVTNSTYYSNQIICLSLPLTLPSGYALPSVTISGTTYTGFNYNTGGSGSTYTNYGFPASTYTPQVIISSYTGNASIGSIIGFTGGIYPPTNQTTTYNVLSNTVPNATPVNSIIVRSNIVNNPCAMPSDILDTFSINASFGSNISYTPPYEKWISIQEGNYSSLTIEFQDQNFNTLQANDPNVLIALILRQGKKKVVVPADLARRGADKGLAPPLKQIAFLDE